MKRQAVKHRILRTAIFVATTASLSLPVRAENLTDAMIGAYNHSGLLQQNQALLRAADEGVALAVSQLRPIVDFTLRAAEGYSTAQSRGVFSPARSTTTVTASLVATLNLYDGGQLRLGVDSARETVLATRQALISVEQRILLRAVAAYLDVLLQSDNVSLRRNNLRVLNEELRAAQDRFEVGEVTRTDVALAQSRLAAARAELASAEGDLRNAQAEYLTAVGRAPQTLAGPPQMPKPPASLDAAKAMAQRTHPDILAARHDVASAELTVMQQKKSLGPSVDARAEVSKTESLRGSDFSDDATLSVTLSQRLYQGGGRAATIRNAIARRDAARGALLQTQHDTLLAVDDAFIGFQVAGASLTASFERVRAAQVAFDGVREEAKLGARTTLDVLSAEQELLNARTAQIQARSQQLLAAYQLLSAQGLLTAEKLRLNVPLYDAVGYYNLVKTAPAAVSKRSKQLDRVLKTLGKR